MVGLGKEIFSKFVLRDLEAFQFYFNKMVHDVIWQNFFMNKIIILGFNDLLLLGSESTDQNITFYMKSEFMKWKEFTKFKKKCWKNVKFDRGLSDWKQQYFKFFLQIICFYPKVSWFNLSSAWNLKIFWVENMLNIINARFQAVAERVHNCLLFSK